MSEAPEGDIELQFMEVAWGYLRNMNDREQAARCLKWLADRAYDQLPAPGAKPAVPPKSPTP